MLIALVKEWFFNLVVVVVVVAFCGGVMWFVSGDPTFAHLVQNQPIFWVAIFCLVALAGTVFRRGDWMRRG